MHRALSVLALIAGTTSLLAGTTSLLAGPKKQTKKQLDRSISRYKSLRKNKDRMQTLKLLKWLRDLKVEMEAR